MFNLLPSISIYLIDVELALAFGQLSVACGELSDEVVTVDERGVRIYMPVLLLL